jgi:hypothetical protein
MGNSITIEVTKPVITIEFGTDIVISPGITPITPSSIIQNLGVKNTDYTVDFNNGRFVTVTTGSGAATITIPDWTYSAESVNTWLYITQGATAKIQTLGVTSGINNNIISSGGLMSAGDALPNSGDATTDAFEFTWNGTNWFVSNVIYDIK